MIGHEQATRLEASVNAARAAGDIPALIALAASAIDQLEPLAATTTGDARIDTLKTCKRIGYNAAADIWPGWETGISRTKAELAAGRRLAERSAGFVTQLEQGPVQQGNAAWLTGAFDLAQGDFPAARRQFQHAADLFTAEPDMALMAQGYDAIAAALLGEAPQLDAIIAALEARGSDDARFFRDQLKMAQSIFAG